MRARVFLAVLAASALVTAGVASARSSHARVWTSPDGAIACGYKIHPRNVAPSELLCVSALIPAPAGSRTPGDSGFVQLARRGRPQRLRLSQDSFVTARVAALKKHMTWSGLGITCAIGQNSVRCVNRAGHGFKITAFSYRAF